MANHVRYTGPDDSRPFRATLTLDSPRHRNALSRALVAELTAALDRAAADPGVRLVVLEASGPSFCSGADLDEARADGMGAAARDLVALQRRLVTLPVPVVARVHGAVRAGGIGLVAASDVAIGADDASYAFTEVRLGLTPAAISLTVLPRLGDRAAALAFLTGSVLDGPAAAAAGLVTRSVPIGELDTAVEAVCAEIVRGHPQGLRETKALLARDLVRRIDDQGAGLAELSARLFGSEAAREAMATFVDRRGSGAVERP